MEQLQKQHAYETDTWAYYPTQNIAQTIIAKKNSSINQTITVRKTLQGIGVERIFLVHSPKLDSITVLRSSKVRRSKLYYLRNLKGKASRLKQTFS